jgi:PAS domain S-box-containing protein
MLSDLFEIAFNSASEGLVVVNEQGEIILVNTRMENLFGYEKSEVIGNKIEMFIPNKHKKRHVGLRDGYIGNPHSRPMGMAGAELKGQRKDGSVFPVEVSLNFFIKDGKKYILGLITDISERVTIEKELLSTRNNLSKLNEELEMLVIQRTAELVKSQQLYEMIAKNFPDGIISVLDKNFKYMFASGRDLKKFNISEKDLIGKDYLVRIEPSYQEELRGLLNLAKNGTNQTCTIEFEQGHYELNIVGIKGDTETVERLLIVEINVTKQKELEMEQAKALSKEKELGEMKSRFVSMASHEFRTPLSAILSSASLIEKYDETDQQEKRVKHTTRIRSSVSNLTSILNDFLSFDKLSSNVIDCDYKEVNICDVISYAVDEVSAFKKQGQRIIIEAEPENCIVSTDEKIVKNILLNLLSNGLKYSGVEGLVKVRLAVGDAAIIIEVTDNGIGIPKSEQSRLFERFFRAENVSNIQGTGLGLNIVKKYTEILRGTISFVSEEGVGTTFRVELPQVKNEKLT